MLLAGCCAAAGIAAAGKLTARVRQLEAAVGLTELFASELRFTLAPMGEVVAHLSRLPGALGFVADCAASCRQGEPFPRAWERAVRGCPGALEQEDIHILLHMGAVLGTVDLEGALGELEYAKFALRQRHTEALSRKSTLGGLYRTLGVLAGAALVVVLF